MSAGIGLPTRPGKRILKAAEAQAWQDGFAFLDAAKRRAAELHDTARSAYGDSFAEGYRDGKTEGAAEAARLLAEVIAKVDRYFGSIEKDVIGLATDVIARVLGEFDANELVAKAAGQAISEMRRSRFIKVSVHPQALDAVRDELAAIRAESTFQGTFEVIADADLPRDGCVVATDIAVVDATIGVQIAAIAEAVCDRREMPE
ncbi:type III secretion system stator protein SctL [Pseudaminobacter sp. 19-2017]|uniref:Type 3 secretion system stator protein n=1 Tax=Pseudaminobacter soli (ex Zhang et al. 2022) TaxID=2831468 RepID=A0A942DXH7_9HYPH|nr:type III secretion system stator protein SctL [Pseudaminobacter soli]MBS3647168.1 type III secretion system stator protein SctL [Pseudaminobacter soli]